MASSEFSTIEISRLLYSSSRLLIQKIQLTLNDFGLTYPQFLVLSILWDQDGLKVHELGKMLNLDSGTLTPLLKKLESQNLLKRKRGEADERTVSIHLTYPGKSLQIKTLAAIGMLEEQMDLLLGNETKKLLPKLEDLITKLQTQKS